MSICEEAVGTLVAMGFGCAQTREALTLKKTFDDALDHLLLTRASVVASASSSASSSSSASTHDVVIDLENESEEAALQEAPMLDDDEEANGKLAASIPQPLTVGLAAECDLPIPEGPSEGGDPDTRSVEMSSAAPARCGKDKKRSPKGAQNQSLPASKRLRRSSPVTLTALQLLQSFAEEVRCSSSFEHNPVDSLAVTPWLEKELLLDVRLPEEEGALEVTATDADVKERPDIKFDRKGKEYLSWSSPFQIESDREKLAALALGAKGSSEWLRLDLTGLEELWPFKSFHACKDFEKSIDSFFHQTSLHWESDVKFGSWVKHVQDLLVAEGKILTPMSHRCRICGMFWARSKKCHFLQEGHDAVEFYKSTGESMQFEVRIRDRRMKVYGRLRSLVLKAEFGAYWKAKTINAWYNFRKALYPILSDELASQHRRIGTFTLQSTQNETEALTPEGFLLSLKPMQRRTLGWMLTMEGIPQPAVEGCLVQDFPEFLSTQTIRRRFVGATLECTVRIERVYGRTSGGILADAVGFGKTCCVLALITSTRRMTPVSYNTAAGLIHSKATLIVLPANLFQQWQDEIRKFVDSDGLMVLPVKDYVSWAKLSVQQIMEADIILVPYAFWRSENYRKHCDTVTGNRVSAEHFTLDRIGGDFQYSTDLLKWRRKAAREAVTKGQITREQETLDAFLERGCQHVYAEARTSPDWREFRARNPLPDPVSYAAQERVCSSKNEDYQALRVLSLEAIGRILNRRLEDDRSLLATTQTCIEFYCFRRICFDELHEGLKFKSDGYSSNDAIVYSAIRLLRSDRRWGLTATPKIESAEDISQLADILQVYINPESPPEAQNFLDHYVRSNVWDMEAIPVQEHIEKIILNGRERALYSEQEHRRGNRSQECIRLCSHYSPDHDCQDSEAAIEHVRRRQRSELQEAQARLRDATLRMENSTLTKEQRTTAAISLGQLKNHEKSIATSINFFENALKSFDACEDCCICCDSMTSESRCMTACGHHFHEHCARMCVNLNGRCPQCRTVLRLSTPGDLIPCPASSSMNRNSRYGSKLCAILQKIETLSQEDPDCKIIIFVQWENLLRKVQGALADCGLPCLRLRGGLSARQSILQNFRVGKAAECRCLLLSLEKSPTGLNLTCANHVVLVHPMVAKTPKMALDYEKQAIGRIRRPGQQKTVHVWRYIASNTIEEKMANEIACSNP